MFHPTWRVHPTQHPLYVWFAMGFLTNIGRIAELKAMQAFWPDNAGKFPFGVSCDRARHWAAPTRGQAIQASV
jgi:hypothetical protein